MMRHKRARKMHKRHAKDKLSEHILCLNCNFVHSLEQTFINHKIA